MWQKIKCWLGIEHEWKKHCSFFKYKSDCKAYMGDIRSCIICPLNEERCKHCGKVKK